MHLARILGAVVALSLAALASPAAAEDGFKVVANRSLGVESLTRDTLSRIFLRKVTRLEGDLLLKPVEPREDSPVARAFTERVHQKSPAALRSYWNALIFSGRDVPPVQKGTDEAVVAYVREHAGAIGYVSPSADASGVAVVQVR